ncbi:uncharacterized protein LOC143882535 [Tasmannia lanceolata]|uniref:uncharacterized protein LOC143882535 n=1 Tax=Tasmannia lanceolata TaxID=3420 RepID=UPI004062FCBF
MSNSNQLRSWQEFESALKYRFGPSPFDDPQGALSKLTQTGSILDYQAKFEELSNKVYGLSDQFLKSCFISGHKPEIQREVIAHQPYGVHQAISHARLQEDKIVESCRMARPWNSNLRTQPSVLGPAPTLYNQKNFNNSPFPTSNSTIPSFKPSSSAAHPSTSKIPIKKLSYAEMQSRREKGLCCNCDERFHSGHKCKNQMSLLLLESENGEDHLFNSVESELQPEFVNGSSELTITFHALMGLNVSKTLRLEGVIANHILQVLVDGGSTHNFIQERVAKFLGLPINHSPHFKVQVGNGQFLTCQGMCSNIQIHIQHHSFTTDLFVISLQGVDVILGVQ